MATYYGTDVDTGDASDVADDGALVSDPRKVITQALLRRWTTPRGMLLSDADYGRDLSAYVNAEVDAVTLNACKSDAKSEAEKDEHVSSCVVNSCQWQAADGTPIVGTIAMRLTINTYDGDQFPLTITISAVTVEVLGS